MVRAFSWYLACAYYSLSAQLCHIASVSGIAFILVRMGAQMNLPAWGPVPWVYCSEIFSNNLR